MCHVFPHIMLLSILKFNIKPHALDFKEGKIWNYNLKGFSCLEMVTNKFGMLKCSQNFRPK